jgi:hypothetical protein
MTIAILSAIMSTSAICDLASEAIASTRSQEQISPRS